MHARCLDNNVLEMKCCRERKNMNLPGVVVDLPTLTSEQKIRRVEYACSTIADMILSVHLMTSS